MKVIIYDDKNEELNLIKKALLPIASDIHTVKTLSEFKEKIKTQDYSICLLDNCLEDNILGIDVGRELIKSVFFPFVLITAQKDSKLLEDVFDAGFEDFVSKPFDVIQLRRKVTACADNYSNRVEREKLYHKMDKELKLGKKLLNQIMPPKKMIKNGMILNWESKSYNIIGGDFVFYKELSAEKEIFAIGDVSGHDIRSALIVSSFQSILSKLINEKKEDLVSIVNSVSEEMSKTILVDDFICIVIGIYSYKTHKVEYISLGMREPLLYSSQRQKKTRNIHGDVPLGWARKKYEQDIIQIKFLEQGEFLIFYTDGVYEKAFSNEVVKNRELQANIEKITNSSSALEMSEKLIASLKEIEKVHDDSTVLCIGRLLKANQCHYSADISLSVLSKTIEEIGKKITELSCTKNIGDKFEIILTEVVTNILKYETPCIKNAQFFLDFSGDSKVYLIRDKTPNTKDMSLVPARLPRKFSSNGYGLYLIEQLCSRIENYSQGSKYVSSFTL